MTIFSHFKHCTLIDNFTIQHLCHSNRRRFHFISRRHVRPMFLRIHFITTTCLIITTTTITTIHKITCI
jgi:hypothetical protein